MNEKLGRCKEDERVAGMRMRNGAGRLALGRRGIEECGEGLLDLLFIDSYSMYTTARRHRRHRNQEECKIRVTDHANEKES